MAEWGGRRIIVVGGVVVICVDLFLSSGIPLGDSLKRICFLRVERVVLGLSVESVQDCEVACKRYDTIDVVVLWGVEPTTGRRHDPLRNELTVRHCCVSCVCVIWSLCSCTRGLCSLRRLSPVQTIFLSSTCVLSVFTLFLPSPNKEGKKQVFLITSAKVFFGRSAQHTFRVHGCVLPVQGNTR